MLIAVIVFLLLLIIFSVWVGAIYVPSTDWVVADMIALAAIQKGETVVDLGSGNGKIVIALAKKDIEAHGYEINPFLVLWSWVLIWKAGVWGKAHVHWGNIFSVEVKRFDVIMVFVVPYIMAKLEKKLQEECNAGTRIIVETFPFPNWKPVKKDNSIFLYKKG